MKLRNTLLALALSIATAQSAVLVSLTENPNSGPQFFLSDGVTLVPDGSFVRIGTFSNGFDPSSTGDFAALAAEFHDFGFTTVGTTNVANVGRIQRTNIGGDASGDPDSFFVSKDIYIWVYNQPGVGSSAPAASASLQQGIFSSSVASVKFADQANALSVSMTNLDEEYGAYNPGTAALAEGSAGGVSKFTLAGQIPEPSVFGLGVLTGLLVLVRRRR